MLESSVRSRLEQAAGRPGSEAEPLARYTTMGCGGPAAFMVEVGSADELAAVLAVVEAEALPWFVLGRGSNLLVADDGWDGIVIRLTGDFKDFSIEDLTVDAGAAVPLSRLAAAAAEAGLTGLEPLALIPGTVGGAVIMNAGAYGTAIADLVVTVEVCLPGEVRRLSRSEVPFSYRRCDLSGLTVVSRATLELAAGDPAAIRAEMKGFQERRSRRQPPGKSCGSVFKNRPEAGAGELIERAGCKGLRAGDAEVSTVHANFIINKGNATAADIITLMNECRRRVLAQSGILLEPEVKLVGDIFLEPLS